MKKSLYVAVLLLFYFSCEIADDNTQEQELYKPEMKLNTDESSLNSRVNSTNTLAFQIARTNSTLYYKKLAEIAPNTSGTSQLSATGIATLNENVYVTYHVRGELYGGEILTFDVTDPQNPVIISSLTDDHADFNDIMMGQYEGNIWVAGARDKSISNYNNTEGAIATKIKLNPDKTPQEIPAWEIPLSSYSASSITRVNPPAGAQNGRIFISSGSRGGLQVVRGNDSDQIFHSRQVDNAKHFDYFEDYGVFLRGIDQNSSAIDVYALDDSFTYSSFNIPYDVTPLGKNGIDVTHGYVYLAMGDDGIIKVNVINGNVEASYKSQGNGFANAVYVDDGIVYVAYGSDGLITLNESDLSYITSYNAEGSCNYVEVKNDLLFLAYGNTGGLTILRKQLYP